MKIQDIGFIIVLAGLILIRKPRILVWVGLGFIVLSIPLFVMKIALFTAERFIIYASFLFMIFVVNYLIDSRLRENDDKKVE